MTQPAVCVSDVCFTPSRFTGKERDAESGNDYFGARYYASSMGRFLSPDWSAKEEPVPYATMDDPQSLNLYAYVRNNPLSNTDADGHCWGSWIVIGGCAEDDPPPAPAPPAPAQQTNDGTVSVVVHGGGHWWNRIGSWFSGVSLGVVRWGRLGGPSHRAAVRALSRLWESEGYTVDQEHLVRTPGGAKSYRFVDVHGEKTNEDGSISERYGQIGRTYANGSPVAREQSALNDIQQATGVKPEFYDYQAEFPMEGGLTGWPVQPAPVGMEIPGAGSVPEEEPVIEP